ncbi:hypothetical protein ACIBL3_46315 [Kribbella sp. NPDC050124]|uniref:hypothetical protein n=1 Tax=Kribbella sp. NPDC050124 TaxID=3364114 RepID=UPI00378F11FF
MSVVDCVFVATVDSPGQVAAWLREVAGCEGGAVDGAAVRMHTRAVTVDEWLGVVAQPNGYIEVDPEPEDIQALDPYAIEIQVRGGRREEVLHAEARLIFDKLVTSRPDLPMLLVHNLDTLVAAHLPGAGTHTFAEQISPDAPDIDTWRPWVVG